jgi:hypothetical protein
VRALQKEDGEYRVIQTAASRKPTPLAALRRHVGLSILLVAVCVAAALAWVSTQPRSYTAEARLAVTGAGLSGETIGSFAVASQELAADYARYVNNAEEQSALEDKLGVDDGSVSEVAASPIPDSNVVRIEVRSKDERTAVAAARQVGDALIARVNDRTKIETEAAETLAQYTALSQQVADAQQAADATKLAVDQAIGRVSSGFPRPDDDVNALRTAASQAASNLAILTVQQEALGQRYQDLTTQTGITANLEVVHEATSKGDDLVVQMQRFGLAGLAAGALLALWLATSLEKRRRRTLAAPARSSAPPTAPQEGGRPLAPTGVGARDDDR